jgi:PAS domain S-box-containing protein
VGEINRAASALKACRLPAYGVHDGAKMLVCSGELAEMFGASSASEVVGREIFSFIAPEERDRAIASIADGGTGAYVSVGVRLDGSSFPIRIESSPVRSRESGEARIVLVRDLSPVALVVDDEPPVARMTAMLMRYAGYQPVTYTSARQALADYQAGDASAVVTDVLMPELDGVSMAQAMRAIDPQLPVVFVSGYTNIVVPNEEGMIFVRKPFGMADLKRALAGLPDRARRALE